MGVKSAKSAVQIVGVNMIVHGTAQLKHNPL